MAIENMEEVIEYVSQNKDNQDLTSALEKAGVVKTLEVFKETELSDDELYNKFIGKQSLRDKVYNENTDKFLAKKLGIELKDLTDDLRKTEFIPKSKLDETVNQFEDFKFYSEAQKKYGDNFEIMKPHIDRSKRNIRRKL